MADQPFELLSVKGGYCKLDELVMLAFSDAVE